MANKANEEEKSSPLYSATLSGTTFYGQRIVVEKPVLKVVRKSGIITQPGQQNGPDLVAPIMASKVVALAADASDRFVKGDIVMYHGSSAQPFELGDTEYWAIHEHDVWAKLSDIPEGGEYYLENNESDH